MRRMTKGGSAFVREALVRLRASLHRRTTREGAAVTYLVNSAVSTVARRKFCRTSKGRQGREGGAAEVSVGQSRPGESAQAGQGQDDEARHGKDELGHTHFASGQASSDAWQPPGSR